jgi:hypothetical protein
LIDIVSLTMRLRALPGMPRGHAPLRNGRVFCFAKLAAEVSEFIEATRSADVDDALTEAMGRAWIDPIEAVRDWDTRPDGGRWNTVPAGEHQMGYRIRHDQLGLFIPRIFEDLPEAQIAMAEMLSGKTVDPRAGFEPGELLGGQAVELDEDHHRIPSADMPLDPSPFGSCASVCTPPASHGHNVVAGLPFYSEAKQELIIERHKAWLERVSFWRDCGKSSDDKILAAIMKTELMEVERLRTLLDDIERRQKSRSFTDMVVSLMFDSTTIWSAVADAMGFKSTAGSRPHIDIGMVACLCLAAGRSQAEAKHVAIAFDSYDRLVSTAFGHLVHAWKYHRGDLTTEMYGVARRRARTFGGNRPTWSEMLTGPTGSGKTTTVSNWLLPRFSERVPDQPVLVFQD